MLTATQLVEYDELDTILKITPDRMKDYQSDSVIYRAVPASGHVPKAGLYQVLEGLVMTAFENRQQMVGLELSGREDFFGFETLEQGSETTAVCVKKTVVVYWSLAEIEHLRAEKPRFEAALYHELLKQNRLLQQSIKNYALYKVNGRIAIFLLHLSRQRWARRIDGSTSILLPPLTHETISHFIGTSRELVTFYLNRFRQLGYISYNRNGIALLDSEALGQELA